MIYVLLLLITLWLLAAPVFLAASIICKQHETRRKVVKNG
jgi:cell division protein FtsL